MAYSVSCVKCRTGVMTIQGDPWCSGNCYHDGYVLIDHSNNYEMAPIFDAYETAREICDKANSNTRFFNRIPVVPIGSPIPRPDDIRVQGPKDD